MGWKDHTFPNADDPDDVEYMIMYWRTVECTSGCTKQDYRLESRQFDHLPKGVTFAQAQVLFNKYVQERRDTGDQTSRKGQTLFLCKVERVAHIHDNQGKALNS
jgi:hypothetical protein